MTTRLMDIVYFHGLPDTSVSPGFAKVVERDSQLDLWTLELLDYDGTYVYVKSTLFTEVEIPNIPVSAVGQRATWWMARDKQSEVGTVVWMSPSRETAVVKFGMREEPDKYLSGSVHEFHRIL